MGDEGEIHEIRDGDAGISTTNRAKGWVDVSCLDMLIREKGVCAHRGWTGEQTGNSGWQGPDADKGRITHQRAWLALQQNKANCGPGFSMGDMSRQSI